jgi:hypothetical protein
MIRHYVIRVGDADDYHLRQDLEEVAGLLKNHGITNFAESHPTGLVADGFEGHNYISLYASPITDAHQIGEPEDVPVSLEGYEVLRLRGILVELWFEDEEEK